MKKILLYLYITFSFFMLIGSVVPSAVFSAPSSPIKISNSECVYKGGDEQHTDTISALTGQVLTIKCLPIMFFNLIYWLLIFAGVVAIFMIIFGGFKFMLSGGDPKAVEGARKTITWAIIGLVVVLLSFAIVGFIADITGVRCITKFGLLGTC